MTLVGLEKSIAKEIVFRPKNGTIKNRTKLNAEIEK